MYAKAEGDPLIQIGLAGWGDHDDLYTAGLPANRKLAAYANYFDLVECDSSFYAIPAAETVARWMEDTPESFQFVVKAYQGMTGHRKHDRYYHTSAEQFAAFKKAVEPIQRANKLGCVLFQYPPWFDCQRKHVDVLRRTRQWMGDLPCALEFRHQSWFQEDRLEQTISYMKQEQWINSICDEPQAGEGSIPIVPIITNAERTVIRFHGRNHTGWVNSGQSNWRDIRYLYRYSELELTEWCKRISMLEGQSKQLMVIFNNNSGGDALHNARQLMQMLGHPNKPLPPQQIHLF